VIGAGFSEIVTSLVADIIMPLVSVLIGGLNFTDYGVVLKPGVVASNGVVMSPAVTLNYGTFLQVVVDFLIIAFCIFMVIKTMNKMKKKAKISPDTLSHQEELLTEIRDLLKK
jgi:large conductance mechanosensitive channel